MQTDTAAFKMRSWHLKLKKGGLKDFNFSYIISLAAYMFLLKMMIYFINGIVIHVQAELTRAE